MAFEIFNQALFVLRPAEGYYEGGEWFEGSESTFTIRSSVQPTSPRDLQLLPEGRRVVAAYTLYSKSVIREKDRITIYGDQYEVLKVFVWQNGILPHYQAIASKMQEELET